MIKDKLRYFVANARFLQSIVSKFILSIPIYIPHNISKYKTLNKIIYTLFIDNIKGDYAEFGCFTGSCLVHSHRCFEKYFGKNKSLIYGFDSFEGFPEEVHKEFKNDNFISSYHKIKLLEKKYEGINIIKGFFSNSLNDVHIKDKIKNISLAFIDCDLAISSQDVFKFIKPRLVNGAFIMIDDYFNLDKNKNSIQQEFVKHFEINKNVFKFKEFGVAGIVFRYNKKPTEL